jgi:shikimate dehydrogenase
MSSQKTIKAGVMGWPIGHSLSPRLHSFWLQNYGIAGSYEAFGVKPEDLPSALHGLEAGGLGGVNLTIPHKVAACAVLDTLDPIARRIGAVNLVIVGERGQLLGCNTDAYGFEQNLLAAGYKPSGGAAFVLGAGGACRAVLVALENMGFTEIRLANRTKEHAELLAQKLSTSQNRISAVTWNQAPQALSDVDLLVNATSLGMTGQPALAFSFEMLPRSASVVDIVYSPVETDLLQRAKQRGHKTIDGLGMLLHQARPSFKAFFGRDPQVTKELRDFVLAGENIP